jgi:hypothetical protein
MTLAETTPSRTRRPRSVDDLDVLKLIRLGVWIAFCVLLLVLR